MPDVRVQKKTSVNRGVERLLRVDIGLMAASIAMLAVGFALAYAVGSATTGPQVKPTGIGAFRLKSFNLAVSGGSPIPDGAGARVGTACCNTSLRLGLPRPMLGTAVFITSV